MRWLALAAILTVCSVAAARGEDAAPPEPDHYRLNDYRAPTPRSLQGARVVTTGEAVGLWKRGGVAFIDVLPRPPKPKLPPGTLWRDEPRLDIPGSIWLPDTGYGALAPAVEAYFRAGLMKATGGARDKIIVIYCLRNCWMSWNAARRAIAIGYRNVVWYPDGTDGWSAAGLPLEQTEPEPRASDDK